MDYKKAADEVPEKIGENDNLITIRQPPTRTRTNIGSPSNYRKKAVEHRS